jgi:acetolactate decarboxylase
MRLRVLPLALVLLVAGTAPAPAGRTHREDDAVFQVSTLGALMAGVLGGAMSYGQLEKHGDFGLGTFHALDGEMIAVDGRFYQVRTDGRAVRVPRSERTPFAMVKWFHADRTLELQGASSMDDLARLLDDAIRTPNVFTAVRIDGRFPQITVRSVRGSAARSPGSRRRWRSKRPLTFKTWTGPWSGSARRSTRPGSPCPATTSTS